MKFKKISQNTLLAETQLKSQSFVKNYNFFSSLRKKNKINY